ncbi:MAG TPA: hypothetical protein VKQ08_09505 [Cyclobacteriaceae bacterium]|nr:hypothetical protein [Cyclobacteriaceae bacterium]
MKDSLGKFIAENRESFDSQMPPESTWKKIENSLPGEKKRLFLDSVTFWRAAAIVLFGLSAFLLVSGNYNRASKQDIAEIQGFSDLENYYSSQISEKMDLVHRYQLSTGLTEDEITQNLKKLEAMYLVLKDEMRRRPTQDVRDALVLNLLVRIDLINQQLNKLDKPMGSKPKSIQS